MPSSPRVALIGLLLCVTGAANAAEIDVKAVVAKSIGDFVRPGYVRLHDTTASRDVGGGGGWQNPAAATSDAGV